MSSINMPYFVRILEDITFVHSLSTSSNISESVHYLKHHFAIGTFQGKGDTKLPNHFSLKIHLIRLASQNDTGQAEKKKKKQDTSTACNRQMRRWHKAQFVLGVRFLQHFELPTFCFLSTEMWSGFLIVFLTLPGTLGLGQCRLVGVVQVVQITSPYMLQGVFSCFTAVAKLTVHAECSCT